MMKKGPVVVSSIVVCLALSSCSTPRFISTHLGGEVYGHFFESHVAEDAPGILLLMGGSGFNPVYDEIAEELVAHGYSVLILDHYGGGTDWGGFGCDTDQEIAAYNENAEAGLAYLRDHEGVHGDHLGIIGFSYGSVLGFNVAYGHPEVRAMVDIYGYMETGPGNSLSENEFVPQLPPTCVIHGDRDRTVRIDRAEEVVAVLSQYGIEHEFLVLPGADHAFVYQENDRTYSDRAIAAAIGFLGNHLR
jgi:dienelactone hydrolase